MPVSFVFSWTCTPAFAMTCLERADEILLANQLSAELAVEGQVDGLGHDQLLARVVGHRPADGVLFDERVGQARGATADRGRDARRSRADDDDVDPVGRLRARRWSP